MSIEAQITSATAQNSQLLQTLAETDYAPPVLQQHNRFVSDLQSELSNLERHIKSLEQKTAKEHKEHEKLQSSIMTRFAYRLGGKKGQAKFSAKEEKEEREYFDTIQEEQSAKGRQGTLRQQLDEAI